MLLLLANLLTFFVLALPLPPAARWTRYAAVIALAIAITQVVAEGQRWQMVPAYGLTIILFSIWLLGIVIPGGIHVNRLASLLGAGVGMLMLVLSITLPILLPVFHFPKPTGPYAIGTVSYHWTDTSRHEIFSADPSAHRELMVQVWYPAKNVPSAPRAPYVQNPQALASSARLLHLPEFIFGHLKYVTTSAIPSALVADDERSYPVLVFLSGRGGYRQSNTFQIEELVSNGYIVVAIDQPYAAAGVVFPDGRLLTMDPRMYDPAHPGHPEFYDRGRVIPYLAQDAIFTLDQLAALNQADPNRILTGRLGLQREGIFGVSLGGVVAGEACRLEPRLRACLVMDAFMPADVVQSGLQQPTMWISRDAQWMQLEGWAQVDIDETQTTMRTVYDSLPGDGYLALVPGMFHINFSDAPYFSPIAPQLGLTGPIDGQRGLDIVNAYSAAFFDKELKNQLSPILDGPSKQYPEVDLQARRH